MPKEYPPFDASSNLGTDPQVMSKLSATELMELSNIEDLRLGLMAFWRYIESRKIGIFNQAKTRITEQGGPVNV